MDFADYPDIYQAADANSDRQQRRFLRFTKTRLAAVVAAAAGGAFIHLHGTTKPAAVVSLAAFGVALFAESRLRYGRAEEGWYDGRAVAESAKTLTWRYLVGGAPLGVERTGPDDVLSRRLRDITTDMKDAYGSGAGSQITTEMRRVRLLPLDERKELYKRDRIVAQEEWYRGRGVAHTRRANRWSYLLMATEAVGVGVASCVVLGVVRFDVLGVCATVVAAGVALIQARQFRTRSRAYEVTARELAEIAGRIDDVDDERDWAHFVDQAEEAISREHILWRASRS